MQSLPTLPLPGPKHLTAPPGDNSPYTKTLIKWIRSDQPIATALANVAAEVYQETNGKQFPWFHYGMIGNFSFMPQAAGSSNTAATVRQDEDAWVERLGAWADGFQIPEKDLPRDKAALLALQKLDLSRYHSPLPKITRLPPEIGQLQQLQVLSLVGNQLTALPAAIGQLQQLRELYLNDNQLTALPAAIGQLQQLQKLFLSDNQLTTLPDEITRLRQLEWLYIENNPKLQLTPAQEQFLQGVRKVDR